MDQQFLTPHSVALQQLINAMHDNVAIIAPDGTIVSVNDTWRQFCRANDGDQTSFYVGDNYLEVCRKTTGEGTDLAARIEDGLSSLLSSGQEFCADYPCHSATEKRWFTIIARPVELDGERYALVVHRNVTTQKVQQVEASHAGQRAINLAAIVATMPDALIAFDLAGRITEWNAAAEKLYGYTADETIGQSMELLHPDNWPQRIAGYIEDIASNGSSHFEVVRQTRSGQKRTIEVTAAAVRSVTGEIVGISKVHRDVTGLRQADRRLRSVLDNLFAFVGVLTPDGTLLEANRAPLEAAGIEAKDVVGKKFWDCYWWSYSRDTQDQLQEACTRALKGELVRYDVQVRIADGRLLWIDFQLAPLVGADGEILNLIPSGIDISERNAAVEALRKSHDTFRNLVERSPFGIYTVDADFRLAHVSHGAQKAFATVRPLIGRDCAEALHVLWPEPFASEAIDHFRHTLETGEPYHSPRMVERRHDIGEVESYDWMIERIMMPDGRLGVVCNFYDLSERQRHEEHVRLLMREVNHRSKNLLTVVMSMARQTARDCTPDDFVNRFGQRLLGLSASQDLIVQGNWDGVTVKDLVDSQLMHLGQESLRDRMEAEGPELILSPAAAQGIGMALHELSTNAIKYGALSIPAGSIAIVWTIDQPDQTFCMRWSEHGGPAVIPPEKSGFGTTVIEKMAAISVGGEVELDYAQGGLTWSLQAPMAQVMAVADAGAS